MEPLHSEIEVTLQTALECGLTEGEYKKILNILGRTPTYTEIGIFGVMWSEHCSYKNSIKQLKTLPRSGGRLLVEAGEENAGLVDVGDGYAIAFKIESHNHPSAIEPFQGAATGVGGILRDIFTMGARPIAALDSLRFGDLDDERTRYLLRGVVHGISHYGNSFGVPTVAGEIYFDKCYKDNPLVNAMAVGIVDVKKTASAGASGVGNPVFILGSRTGRDGIHGASLLASREFDEETENMRPTVQVGDPFAEKLLLEATIELIEAGVIAGIQDMGAAGISCSTSEMSAKTGVGMKIDLDRVPLREQGMSAYEIMLSESQERMLAVIHSGMEEKARRICKKWDVPITEIGQVTNGGYLEIRREGKKVAHLPANDLVLGGGAPQYDREYKEPAYLADTRSRKTENIKSEHTFEQVFHTLLNEPTIASKRWVTEQYDSQVRTNTVRISGDAAVMRLKELPGRGIAVTTDCNSRYCYLDPYMGAKAAVAEAARNVVCVGAKPVAITNCLNFGNPYDPEAYWQFREAVRGMGEACRAFDTPVTGGNVSFHNESQNHAIYPTPTIGMLGIIEDLNKVISSGFKSEGDVIIILGDAGRNEFGGSQYQKLFEGDNFGDAPEISLEDELRLFNAIYSLNDKGLINSSHDVSEGGAAIALAEKAFTSDNRLGFEALGELSKEFFFNESQTRIIITVAPENAEEATRICEDMSVPARRIGVVKGTGMKFGEFYTIEVEAARAEYEKPLVSR